MKFAHSSRARSALCWCLVRTSCTTPCCIWWATRSSILAETRHRSKDVSYDKSDYTCTLSCSGLASTHAVEVFTRNAPFRRQNMVWIPVSCLEQPLVHKVAENCREIANRKKNRVVNCKTPSTVISCNISEELALASTADGIMLSHIGLSRTCF